MHKFLNDLLCNVRLILIFKKFLQRSILKNTRRVFLVKINNSELWDSLDDYLFVNIENRCQFLPHSCLVIYFGDQNLIRDFIKNLLSNFERVFRALIHIFLLIGCSFVKYEKPRLILLEKMHHIAWVCLNHEIGSFTNKSRHSYKFLKVFFRHFISILFFQVLEPHIFTVTNISAPVNS